jgi:glycosyltransferase involved in cell wall biosynthesis
MDNTQSAALGRTSSIEYGNSERHLGLSIIVPAFNEHEGLGVTLDGLLRAFPSAEVIVVDDCSTDGTADVAESRNVRVIRHMFNQGQGAALKQGVRASTREYVAWFDADNEHRCEDLDSLFKRITSENLAAAIGQRKRSSSITRGMGKWLIRLIGKGLKIRIGVDLNCGLRVFRRQVLMRYLPIVPDRFSASLVTTLIMVERGYPIGFEPIETNDRIGTSTVRLRDGFEAILMLLRCVLLFAPMRVFLPLGAGLLVLGAVYSIATALIMAQGLPVGGILVILTGVLSTMLGLIADQISQIRLSQLPDLYLTIEPRHEDSHEEVAQ